MVSVGSVGGSVGLVAGSVGAVVGGAVVSVGSVGGSVGFVAGSVGAVVDGAVVSVGSMEGSVGSVAMMGTVSEGPGSVVAGGAVHTHPASRQTAKIKGIIFFMEGTPYCFSFIVQRWREMSIPWFDFL